MSDDARPLTPEARIREHIEASDGAKVPLPRNPDGTPQGYEVPLAGGLAWTLYPIGSMCEDAEVSTLQDELYETMAYDGKIARTLLYRAFEACLRINYDLTDGETAVLFFGVDPEHRRPAPGGTHLQLSPVQAVIAAVLPSECPADMTYSDWLDSALLINGIAPASVPPERLPAVLGHLIALGKAVPPERFVSAAISGAERSKGRALAASHAPEPPPA